MVSQFPHMAGMSSVKKHSTNGKIQSGDPYPLYHVQGIALGLAPALGTPLFLYICSYAYLFYFNFTTTSALF